MSSDEALEPRRLSDDLLAPWGLPLVLSGQSVLHFTDGHAIGFGVSENRANHVDERSCLAELGDCEDRRVARAFSPVAAPAEPTS